MRLILTCFFLTHFITNILGQSDSLNNNSRIERIFSYNHLSFLLATNWTQKAKTESIGGKYYLGAETMRGWEVGINYFINLPNNSYSIILGLHGSAIPRNHSLFIPKEDFSPQRAEDFSFNRKLTRTFDLHLYLPISIEKRWFFNNNSIWNINTGIALGYYPDEIFESWYYQNEPGQSPILDLDLLVSSNFKPWFNYIISTGYSWIMRSSNILRINLQANYTGFNLAKGSYEINVPGSPVSYGNYQSRLSGAGLSFQYVLTQSRKKLIKKYKSDLKHRGF